MGRNFGGSAPFLEREAGYPSNTKSPGSRPTSVPSGILIHPAIWPQQIWAENWGLCPFGGGGTGSPSNTMLTHVAKAEAYLRAKFHLEPSNRLATVHQRHRQIGQDRQTDRQTDNGLVV